MARPCEVTGRTPGFGKSVSHSHRRTSRRWDPNTHRHHFWLPSENRRITLMVSTKGLRTIDKRGIEAVVRDLRASGVKV